MFTHYHAAEFEVASHRARRRWAENIDRLLGDTPADHPAEAALREARDILLDPRVAVQTADLHDLLLLVRDGSTAADDVPEALAAFVAAYRQTA